MNGGCGRETTMGFENGLKTIVVATDLEGRRKRLWSTRASWRPIYGARIVLAHGLDPIEYAAVDGSRQRR